MNRPEGYCPQAVRERHALRKADRCEWERPSRLYVERENSPATGIVNGVLFMCAFVGIPLALLGALFF